jgi:hypothetical protein
VAVFNQKCGGYKLKINDADHPPPRCHVGVEGRNASVDLVTFEVLNPPPHHLPPKLVKCLRKHQEHMLKAWEEVVILE